MAAVVGIVSERSLSIHMRRSNWPNKSKQLSNKMSILVIKVGVVDIGVHVSSHLKEEPDWGTDKWLLVISIQWDLSVRSQFVQIMQVVVGSQILILQLLLHFHFSSLHMSLFCACDFFILCLCSNTSKEWAFQLHCLI